MSRRDKWKEVRDSITMSKGEMGKTVEERETMPAIACGYCKNFFENAYNADGRGSCKVLKMGSNIKTDPPVFVMAGDTGLIAYINTNAQNCTYYDRMELIDTDLNEITDPAYRRSHRIMEKR
jgi:hypothetical protein